MAVELQLVQPPAADRRLLGRHRAAGSDEGGPGHSQNIGCMGAKPLLASATVSICRGGAVTHVSWNFPERGPYASTLTRGRTNGAPLTSAAQNAIPSIPQQLTTARP